MTRAQPDPSIESPIIGKRVNIAGQIGTVVAIYNDPTPICAEVKYDDSPIGGGVLISVIESLPTITPRASFNYKPGDRG